MEMAHCKVCNKDVKAKVSTVKDHATSRMHKAAVARAAAPPPEVVPPAGANLPGLLTAGMDAEDTRKTLAGA
jgi:hypothetical protein